jgi:beta-1,4-mannosyl-glycoprotein beta-1,4-N-acetylglucosaminyltransferase
MLLDCFLFNNEYDLLEGRLEYLDSMVDKFIIIEADSTFNGSRKRLNFLDHIDRYSKFLPKIFYYPLHVDLNKFEFEKEIDKEGFTYETPAWRVEKLQRNYIQNALEFFEDTDHVLIGDLDEIPHKYGIIQAKHYLAPDNITIGFKQDCFFFNFNQIQEKPCYGTVLTTVKNVKDKSPQLIRENRWGHIIKYVEHGGWHLTYWGSIESIRDKIMSFSHQEFNKSEYTDTNNILDRIKRGIDPLGNEGNPLIKINRNNILKEFLDIFEKYEFKVIDHYYNDISGNFLYDDYFFYKQTFDKIPKKGKIVELGSDNAKTSCFLAVENSNSGKKISLTCVDDQWKVNNNLENEFIKNMNLVSNSYYKYHGNSSQLLSNTDDNSLDFVFINKSFDIENDIKKWNNKLKFGGIIGGYDYAKNKNIVDKNLKGVNLIGNCWWTHKAEYTF